MEKSLFQTKKSLGQNFLKSEAALAKIVEAANLTQGDVVLEVGPGKGNLTEKLLERAGKVIAVEKDDRLIPVLKKKFAAEIASGKLELVHEDILKFSPLAFNLTANSYKLTANLPFYITGQFFRKFLSEWPKPLQATILVQKEVAERIIGKGGKESILSISVKTYGKPRYVSTVKAGSFSPPPKVDSAIISIENISKKLFTDVNERKFFEVIKAGFAHKRKILAGNLKNLLKQKGADFFSKCQINEKVRAEDLKLENWICLAKEMRD